MKSILRTLVSLILCASLAAAPTAPVVVNPNTSVLISPTAAALLAANPTLGSLTSITGTANEITVTGTTTPTLSLPSALTFTSKTITGGTINGAAFNGTLGATTPSTIAGTTGVFSGTLNTSGANAQIYTSGSDAMIRTSGANASIYTAGSDAIIATYGANAYIQSRSMFKLFDGTFTTTLSHAPSADRAIAFPNASGTLATLEGANVFTGATVNSTAGAASLPAMRFSGVPFAGTGTTSFPLVYIADANATASTVLSTAGTYFGVNGDGTQDLMHLLKDGASRFKVGSEGNITALGNITLGIHSILGDGANNLIIRSASNICRINGAGVGDDRLVLGATTDAFPQFRRSGIGIVVGLADNTDGGSFTCSGTLAVNGATTLTGNLTSNGALISVPEALAPALDAGAAVGVTTLTSTIAVNGTNAVTLANGTNGQIKTIVCTAVTSAGTATVTPTTANGFTTIAFTAAGQSVTLQYFTTGGWVILSVRNATIAALGDAQRHRCSGEALALCA